MTTNRTRLALAGTTALSLLIVAGGIAGAQSTTGQGGATNGFGLGVGQGQDQTQARGMGGGMGEGHHRGHGDMDGDHGGFPGGPMDPFGDGRTIVRQETVAVLPDGTFATSRLEHGTVTAAAADALTFTLATGETVTVTIDAATIAEEAPAFLDPGVDGAPGNGDAFGRGWGNAHQGGMHAPGEPGATIDVATIAAGTDVMVESEAQADGSFLATHIHVLPAAATAVPAPDASAAPASNG